MSTSYQDVSNNYRILKFKLLFGQAVIMVVLSWHDSTWQPSNSKSLNVSLSDRHIMCNIVHLIKKCLGVLVESSDAMIGTSARVNKHLDEIRIQGSIKVLVTVELLLKQFVARSTACHYIYYCHYAVKWALLCEFEGCWLNHRHMDLSTLYLRIKVANAVLRRPLQF